jgi:hypothetical protein
MTDGGGDFRSRVQSLLERDGIVLTDRELTRMAERYPRCGGREPWDVREYARAARPGAREYRVMRGTSVEDVYAGVERATASAVRTALNEIDYQDLTGRVAAPADLGP